MGKTIPQKYQTYYRGMWGGLAPYSLPWSELQKEKYGLEHSKIHGQMEECSAGQWLHKVHNISSYYRCHLTENFMN